MEFFNDGVDRLRNSVVGMVIPINASSIEPICEPYLLGQVQDCFRNKALYVSTCQTAPMIAKYVFGTVIIMFAVSMMFAYLNKRKVKT